MDEVSEQLRHLYDLCRPLSQCSEDSQKKMAISVLPLAFTLISCLVYSSSLKMEATCSSETDYMALYP
jgi:hypothetical protein